MQTIYNVKPSSVFVCTPTHDGSLCVGYVNGLMQSMGMFGGACFMSGMSHVALARCLQAHAFLKSPFEWLLSIDADIQFSKQDLDVLYSGDESVRVAEYSKKDFTSPTPAQFGMGFVLIHRDVFGALDEVASADGDKLVQQFFREGELVGDYFPSGAMPDGHWTGEDQGFFKLCHLAGVSLRVETRTRLIHWGRHGYHYTPPSANDEFPPVDIPPA